MVRWVLPVACTGCVTSLWKISQWVFVTSGNNKPVNVSFMIESSTKLRKTFKSNNNVHVCTQRSLRAFNEYVEDYQSVNGQN